MDCKMEQRKVDFLRNYKDFRRHAKEYTKAHKIRENLYRLTLYFNVDRVQHEIVLTLNLLEELPIAENVPFQLGSGSKVFGYVMNMARLQNQFINAKACLPGNSAQLEGLGEIQRQYAGKQPLVLTGRLQRKYKEDDVNVCKTDGQKDSPPNSVAVQLAGYLPHLQCCCYEKASTAECTPHAKEDST